VGKINREAAIETLSITRQCAIDTGVYDYMFPGYGTLLGFVRENDLIGHDDDTDMCILADKITAQQEHDFYRLLKERGMFKHREKIATRRDTARYLWHSMKRRHGKKGLKCCTWYQQLWRGHYWHSKARSWVKKIGVRLRPEPNPESDAIMKGVKADLMWPLIEREFLGMKFMFPLKYPALLDVWYLDWKTPQKGGSSREEILCIVGDWDKEKTWTTRRRWP